LGCIVDVADDALVRAGSAGVEGDLSVAPRRLRADAAHAIGAGRGNEAERRGVHAGYVPLLPEGDGDPVVRVRFVQGIVRERDVNVLEEVLRTEVHGMVTGFPADPAAALGVNHAGQVTRKFLDEV